MNKEQKHKVQLQQRTLNESLTFQTMFGAKQKFDSLTPEIETRIKEELLVRLSSVKQVECPFCINMQSFCKHHYYSALFAP